MATPLAQLLHDVIHEPDARAQFATSPESFLVDHGYESIDAADIREALYVLADGSAPAEASAYAAGGDAIDVDADDAGGLSGAVAGLTGMLASVFGLELGDDPSALDTDDLDVDALGLDDDLDGTDLDGTDLDGTDLDDALDVTLDVDDDPVPSGLRRADDDADDDDRGSNGLDLDDLDDLDPIEGGDGLLDGLDAGMDLLDGLPELTIDGVAGGLGPTPDPPAPAAGDDGWDDVI